MSEISQTPTYDPSRQQVSGLGYLIRRAGQYIREDVYLHIYFYEDDESRFYFVVERLKRAPAPATDITDTGICDVQLIGYDRDKEPGYQRSREISADQKRVALPRILEGMRIMEIPTYGPPQSVRISIR